MLLSPCIGSGGPRRGRVRDRRAGSLADRLRLVSGGGVGPRWGSCGRDHMSVKVTSGRIQKNNVKKIKEKLTSLSAASVIRHSLNGGDGLDSATVCRNSDCSFGHDGFIHLKSDMIGYGIKMIAFFLCWTAC